MSKNHENHENYENYEVQKVKNIAEFIGKLVLDGYRMDKGLCSVTGHVYDYESITMKKRFAYYDDDKYLQGFDAYIDIDCKNGEIIIRQKPVEKYRAF